mmetsp:Transcript_59075/g.144921  ORF Transcript_59075/g.144921 Transcript_59075/m.144921 type:complete len:270 (+) Transcript_59075:149-958(+)
MRRAGFPRPEGLRQGRPLGLAALGRGGRRGDLKRARPFASEEACPSSSSRSAAAFPAGAIRSKGWGGFLEWAACQVAGGRPRATTPSTTRTLGSRGMRASRRSRRRCSTSTGTKRRARQRRRRRSSARCSRSGTGSSRRSAWRSSGGGSTRTSPRGAGRRARARRCRGTTAPRTSRTRPRACSCASTTRRAPSSCPSTACRPPSTCRRSRTWASSSRGWRGRCCASTSCPPGRASTSACRTSTLSTCASCRSARRTRTTSRWCTSRSAT